MWSKNKALQTPDEARHVEAVTACACVLCDAPGPSEAHEIVQGLWWLSIAACPSCHRGPQGIHGDQTMLLLRFKARGEGGELLALNETLARVAALENA